MRYIIFAIIMLMAGTSFGQMFGRSPYYGDRYRRASTIAEGYGRGLGDVVRSRGLNNLYNSRAAINYEEARKKYIENRKLWTQTYFEMREINREYRFGDLVPQTQEQLQRRALSKLPDRLPEGELSWPVVLRAVEFDNYRVEIDTLFKLREEFGQLEIGHIIKIRKLADEMREIVRDYKDYLPGNLTIEANKYLASLKYESDRVVGG
jgi:hypothetical protein